MTLRLTTCYHDSIGSCAMGQILVRKVDDMLKARLKERAVREGVSMEEEARRILHGALMSEEADKRGLGTRIAELFRSIEGDDEPLPTLPIKHWKPMSFDE